MEKVPLPEWAAASPAGEKGVHTMPEGAVPRKLKESILLTAALLSGWALAWIDARPHWDDSGILAGLMLISSGALGMLGPRRPWLWALAVGVWIPLHMVLRSPAAGTVATGLAILAIPMAGSYAGMGLRRLLTAA